MPPIFFSLIRVIAFGVYNYPRIANLIHVAVFTDAVSSIEILLVLEVRHYVRSSYRADILPNEHLCIFADKTIIIVVFNFG